MDRRSFIGKGLIGVLLSAVLTAAGCRFNSGSVTTTNSVYDRVTQSGTIRASYAVYPPYCIKDPNTGKMSGLFVDVLEEAGRRLGLKVEWTEEVGWGSIFEGLNANRDDVFGAGLWQNASRSKAAAFSNPIIFNPIMVWVRSGDTRFNEKDFESLNSPKVKISVQDGAVEDLISKSDYPLAARVSVPQLSPWTDVLLNITSRKADLTFAEPAAVDLFLDKNPGTLTDIDPENPIRVFPNAYAFKLGEVKLQEMLNGALDEMIDDGTMEKLIRKYEHHPGEFYRVAKPYAIPEKASGSKSK
jgi:ABC-type amino acid transport substrate-binding protein